MIIPLTLARISQSLLASAARSRRFFILQIFYHFIRDNSDADEKSTRRYNVARPSSRKCNLSGETRSTPRVINNNYGTIIITCQGDPVVSESGTGSIPEQRIITREKSTFALRPGGIIDPLESVSVVRGEADKAALSMGNERKACHRFLRATTQTGPGVRCYERIITSVLRTARESREITRSY